MAKTRVLSNSYIPLLTPVVTAKVLSKLNTNSLYDLCLFWCKWSKLTKPNHEADRVYNEILQMKKDKRSKRRLIDSILSEYWPKGLNLLQTSQIDVQNIVDKPSHFQWVSSTARTSDDKKFIINLDSQLFLNRLVKNLSSLYLSHIYISKHPHYPLILIRIQVFDYSIIPLTKNTINNRDRKFIVSRRPFFLAIPMNSPHIIHSDAEEEDIVCQLVLQSVENCMSTSVQQVRLFKDQEESGVRNLETMHIFKGVSRFGSSLGSWTPYADGTVDISPVGKLESHFEINQSKIFDDDDDDDDDGNNIASSLDDSRDLLIRKKISNLRFKGTELPLKSERLYEDNRPIKKRKFTSSFREDGGEEEKEKEEEEGDDDEATNARQGNPYKSIAPVQRVEGNLVLAQDVAIKFKFEGNDVFAGLHELCVRGVVDPVKIPGWLTGEGGNKFVNVQRSSEGCGSNLI